MHVSRYDYFYHFPVAHVLLYGVCRDFWRLVLRKPSDELPQGNRVRIPTPVRKEMTALFKTLKVTSSFSSTPKDVTKCALQEFTGESPHLLRSCLRMAMLYPDLMKYDA